MTMNDGEYALSIVDAIMMNMMTPTVDLPVDLSIDLSYEDELVPFDDFAPLPPHSIEAKIGNTPLLDLSAFAHRRGVSPPNVFF